MQQTIKKQSCIHRINIAYMDRQRKIYNIKHNWILETYQNIFVTIWTNSIQQNHDDVNRPTDKSLFYDNWNRKSRNFIFHRTMQRYHFGVCVLPLIFIHVRVHHIDFDVQSTFHSFWLKIPKIHRINKLSRSIKTQWTVSFIYVAIKLVKTDDNELKANLYVFYSRVNCEESTCSTTLLYGRIEATVNWK